jgi:hypothetical protein
MKIAEIKKTLLESGKNLYGGSVIVNIKHEGGKGFKSLRYEYVAYITTPRFNTVYKAPETLEPKGFISFVDDLAYWLADKMNR